MALGITLAESGMLPDALTRMGIRRLLRKRLRDCERGAEKANERALQDYLDSLRASPIAVRQDAANSQHYEVPAAFFELVLGPHLKYSGCLFDDPTDALDRAEAAMLDLTCDRAQLDGAGRILELGCGWGSLSLHMARRYPDAQILALSNSASQRQFIQARAAQRGLDNLQVITQDLTDFEPDGRFDRIVSVECLEHMRNYAELFRRFASWLQDGGAAFFHVFCHARFAYLFEEEGKDDWMGRHFFSGGQMPSYDLFRRFDRDLQVEQSWRVNGRHYGATARAWLENMDRQRRAVCDVLVQTCGTREGRLMYQRWRIFFMACEELFNFNGGQEWFVGHYLLRPRAADSAAQAISP